LKPEEERITLEALEAVIVLLKHWKELTLEQIKEITHLSDEGAKYFATIIEMLDCSILDWDKKERKLTYREPYECI